MNRRDLAHRRLVNQRISKPTFERPADVVDRLCAVQAQDFAGSKWARLDSLSEEDPGVIGFDFLDEPIEGADGFQAFVGMKSPIPVGPLEHPMMGGWVELKAGESNICELARLSPPPGPTFKQCDLISPYLPVVRQLISDIRGNSLTELV